ncbi:hypothetical protein HNW13_017550 [Shewanella sp. BF02_Schw]|uniref:hypothetical protein n=1 Tax=Shewanella sp. BF02_Schw TaxID=394908 RepID=UPI001786E13F|nr:hypothetical protein [Shewanella sp. BF02_Schw]MBO1897545.1 hypothetical protein [Shewanella sp. BF02_Schw]
MIHEDDGTVMFNDGGQQYLEFENIRDFAEHHFLNASVKHSASYYVGDRNDDGTIDWHDQPYDINEIDNDEGDCVYTKSKLVDLVN